MDSLTMYNTKKTLQAHYFFSCSLHFWPKFSFIFYSDAGWWKTLGVPVILGRDNLPCPVGIWLTDLPNIRHPKFRHHWIIITALLSCLQGSCPRSGVFWVAIRISLFVSKVDVMPGTLIKYSFFYVQGRCLLNKRGL